MSDEILVKVEGVSKKFCRSLKRSLWYGVQDVSSELMGRPGGHGELRKNEFWAVNDVSFELKRGECLGLIGPNGAGKSTLLKMLNGLVKPDKGRITMRGRIGALIELGAGFNPILTGRENIYINGSVLGFTKKEIDQKFDAIVDFAEIEEFIDTPVQNYSSGMKVRLGFSVAAQMEPDVLLIDEVLAVGDLHFKMSCYRRIFELVEIGVSLLLVSHNMTDIARVCERVAVIKPGSFDLYSSISEGVCEYQSAVKKNKALPIKSQAGKPIEIIRVEVKNHHGHEAAFFETGDDVFFDISIASKMFLAGARMVVTIDSAVGPLNSTSTAYSGFRFDIHAPGTKIRFVLKSVPLLVGAYFVTVGLNGQDKAQPIDQVIHAASFRVAGPELDAFGFGLGHIVKMEHEWKLLS